MVRATSNLGNRRTKEVPMKGYKCSEFGEKETHIIPHPTVNSGFLLWQFTKFPQPSPFQKASIREDQQDTLTLRAETTWEGTKLCTESCCWIACVAEKTTKDGMKAWNIRGRPAKLEKETTKYGHKPAESVWKEKQQKGKGERNYPKSDMKETIFEKAMKHGGIHVFGEPG